MEKCKVKKLWVVRNLIGSLYFYVLKPQKLEQHGIWFMPDGYHFSIDEDLFPSVKWTDKEPRRVKIILED